MRKFLKIFSKNSIHTKFLFELSIGICLFVFGIVQFTSLIAPKPTNVIPKIITVPIFKTAYIPQKEYIVINQEQEEIQEVEQNYIEMDVVASAYCIEPHHHICNDGNASKTATGTTPTAGRTIAVDPNIIPYGSKVEIDGHIYIAEDTGGAIKGNRIDIVFNTHQEALNFGMRDKTIKIYK